MNEEHEVGRYMCVGVELQNLIKADAHNTWQKPAEDVLLRHSWSSLPIQALL